MLIKGWSITVGMGLIGYAFTYKKRAILLLSMVAAFCFILVDAKFKEYQVVYYKRMETIENCFKSGFKPEKKICFTPAIDLS